ncbi:hypothetical protein NQ318_016231 [Aromia moschata]|uniref:C2H2-type domain-containing protein n=1 Tax=Aromia moschata TaxID=1265417 RepID=A0AAV8XAG8_9CUCU|nr:hypothetical protein NQ318_016231 [Aromia moschata]
MDSRDDRDDSDDFHHSLEPVVIINDEETAEENANKGILFQSDPLSVENSEKEDFMNSIGPEISIIPVKKRKPQIKIRLFEKEYSPSRDETNSTKVQRVITRSPREKVRRVSKDEALNAEDTYAKRKSNPLEKCPICKKYFRRMKTHLLKHELITRSPEDRLLCSLCMKAFNTQSNLAIHMRTHTGDKPYICEICQKSFSQSCNLVNHMRNRH